MFKTTFWLRPLLPCLILSLTSCAQKPATPNTAAQSKINSAASTINSKGKQAAETEPAQGNQPAGPGNVGHSSASPDTDNSAGAEAADEKALSRAINACSDNKEKFSLVCRLADLKENSSNLQTQETLLQELAANARENFGLESPEYASVLVRQGRLFLKQKDYTRSTASFKEANALYLKKGKEYDCSRIECISGQLASECPTGKCSDERELYEQLLDLRLKCLGDRNPQTVIAMMALGEVYSREHKYKEALKHYSQAYYKVLGGVPVERNWIVLALARTYIGLKDFKKAEPLLKAALASEESKAQRAATPTLFAVLKTYASYYDEQKMYKEELATIKRMLDLSEANLGKQNPKLNSTLTLYADALEKAGKATESQAVRVRISRLEKNGS